MEPPVAEKVTLTLGNGRLPESRTTNTGTGVIAVPTWAVEGPAVSTLKLAGAVRRGSLDELQAATPTSNAAKTSREYLITFHLSQA
jgi:hypothetical protein